MAVELTLTAVTAKREPAAFIATECCTKMRVFVTVAVFAALVAPASAWEGADTETGGSVEIETGNLVRSGSDIEIYDADAGEYRDVTVESVTRSGSTVEVEVYDSESGEYRTFEMEGN